MAGNGNLFKPSSAGGKVGTKKQDDGQFSNPPAYPEVSGFTGPSKIGGKSSIMNLQKSPSAKSGRV